MSPRVRSPGLSPGSRTVLPWLPPAFPGAAGWAGPEFTPPTAWFSRLHRPADGRTTDRDSRLRHSLHHPLLGVPSLAPEILPSSLPDGSGIFCGPLISRHLSPCSQHIRDLSLPLTFCVTPGEPTPLSGPQGPHLYNEDLY